MYWPNEPAHLYPKFTQAGGRTAFEGMAEDATIAALKIYSYRVERARFATLEAWERDAIAAICSFEPDILFVQHLFETDLRESFWREVRRDYPHLTLIYHDDDPFDTVVKRLDRATCSILPHAHLVLLSGLGRLADLFRSRGATVIGYMPSCFVADRFALHDPAMVTKRHDIVMIGSNGRRRWLKFAYVPGGRRRAALAKRLTDEFGNRFALYGNGWSHLPTAKGRVPFFEQEVVAQSGKITANWDHFDTIEFYFSDRLPISLAAGVPHVTTRHVGYDLLFAGCPGFYACDTVSEVVDTCRWLLSRPNRVLVDEGMAAREWALARFDAMPVFRDALNQSLQARASLPSKQVLLSVRTDE
jgi:hypothetical protein